MEQSIKTLLVFATGATIGSFVTWNVLKETYNRIAQDEIESVKESWRLKYEGDRPITKVEVKKPSTAPVGLLSPKESSSTIKIERREDRTNYNNPVELGNTPMESTPVVIAPDEFGDIEDYNKVSLTYFSDGVLFDDATNKEIMDPDELVGIGSLDTFGEFEADSVFIRNDGLECYYEILADDRTWDEFCNERPDIRRGR